MRPEFIPREIFRAWVKPQQLRDIFRVDNIQPASYIARCNYADKPLPSLWKDGRRLVRAIDICARAKANGHSIGPAGVWELADERNRLLSERDALLAETSALSAKREARKHELEMFDFAESLTSRTLLRENEIVAGRSRVLPARCGVYFLIKDKRVIYVGQSVSLLQRLGSHAVDKEFDSFSFIACDKDALDVLESLYIHALRPPLNGRYDGSEGGKNIAAPLRLDELRRLATRPQPSPPQR